MRERGPEYKRLTIAVPPSPHGCGVRPRKERSRVVTIDDCDATITVRCEAEVGTQFRVATIDDCDATFTARLR